MSTLVFVIANALLLGAAWGSVRRFVGVADGLERALAVAAAVVALLLPSLTLLGAAGALAPLPALLLVAVLAVVLWSPRALPARAVAVPAPAAPSSSRPARGVAAAIGAVALLQGYAWLRPQLLGPWRPQWDDLSYHAPMTAHWLQAEKLVLAPYNYHAYYPGNAELFAAWFMLPTKLDAYAAIAGAYWLVLAGLAVAVLCRRLGCGRATTTLGVLAFVLCDPLRHNAGSFAAADLAGAAAVTAALALAAGPGAVPEQPDRGRAWLIGSLLGAATGCKITFAPLAALVALYFVLEHARRRSRTQLALGVALGALACGAAFYVRNAVLTGNPLFPAEILGFDGPLNAKVRGPTSLFHQLQHAKPRLLETGLRELFNWPAPVAWFLIGAYALTAILGPRPAALRSVQGRSALVLLVTGVLAFVVVAAGPFSGTPNSPRPELLVRLRFFLPTALLAIPLAMLWVERAGRGRERLVLAVALGVAAAALALTRSALWLELVAAAAAAAIAARSWPRAPRLGARAALAAGAVACLALPAALAFAMSAKQIRNDRVMRRDVPAWRVLNRLPDGSRIAWYSTFESARYYPLFGRGLSLVPIAVQSNGARYAFLHDEWSRKGVKWFGDRRKGPRRPRAKVLANLRKQGIEYVLTTKRHAGKWPTQIKYLEGADGVRVVKRGPTFVLYELAQERAERHAER